MDGWFDWSKLQRIYGGIIGKVVFIISLGSPFSKLNIAKPFFGNFEIFFLGSMLIGSGYVITQLFMPNIPKLNKSKELYANNQLERLNKQALDLKFEFEALSKIDNKNLDKLLLKSNLPDEYKMFFPPSDTSIAETFGYEKVTYYSSLLNYEYYNTKNCLIRFLLMMLFCLGMIMLYSPAVSTAIKILLGN